VNNRDVSATKIIKKNQVFATVAIILLKNTILLMKSQLVTNYTLKHDVNRCFRNPVWSKQVKLEIYEFDQIVYEVADLCTSCEVGLFA
jgi:hypothetical protein